MNKFKLKFLIIQRSSADKTRSRNDPALLEHPVGFLRGFGDPGQGAQSEQSARLSLHLLLIRCGILHAAGLGRQRCSFDTERARNAQRAIKLK